MVAKTELSPDQTAWLVKYAENFDRIAEFYRDHVAPLRRSLDQAVQAASHIHDVLAGPVEEGFLPPFIATDADAALWDDPAALAQVEQIVAGLIASARLVLEAAVKLRAATPIMEAVSGGDREGQPGPASQHSAEALLAYVLKKLSGIPVQAVQTALEEQPGRDIRDDGLLAREVRRLIGGRFSRKK